MTRTRWLLAVLMSSAWLLGLGATPALACSCVGAEMLVQFANGGSGDMDDDVVGDLGYDVAFHGSVIDSGDSDVTALWAANPPRPGLALLFEVTEVRAGDVGSTVVIHTPGGTPMSGDCSVGVLTGEQFVITQRGTDGHLVAGMCSIFPGVIGQSSISFEALFGTPRAPDPDLAAASLSDIATRPPDTDEPGAKERYEEYGGTTATSATTTSTESAEGDATVPPMPVVEDELSQTMVWLFSGAFLAAAIALAVYAKKRQRRRQVELSTETGVSQDRDLTP